MTLSLARTSRSAVLSAEVSLGDAVAVIRREALPEVAAFLRDGTLRMTVLLDLTCVHHPGRPEAFEMVYHFLSLETNARIRVKAGLPIDHLVPGMVAEAIRNNRLYL